jgi:hypothetical protein
MPAGVPMGPIIGCNSGGVSTGTNGDQVTMAHELGHACGLPHSPCGVGGDPNFPAYEPYDAGGVAHAFIGEYGLNINDGTIMSPATFRDWMSYCSPDWVSLYNYGRLLDNANLDPKIVCEDHPWILDHLKLEYELPWPPRPIPVLWRRSTVIDPEPILSIIGIMHAEDKMEVKSVMRLNAVRQAPKGEETDLIAELLGEEGKVLDRAPVFRLPSMGTGCGCESKSQSGAHPCVFQVFLSDVEPGAALRIRRGGVEFWSRRAPASKARVASLSVKLSKEGDLIARYKVERGGEYAECWLQWSDDRGKTWHGLATGLGVAGARLASPDLPAGQIQVRLLAGNGFHTVASEPVSLRVPERPPVVSILSPRDRQVLLADQPMRLWGAVSAPGGGEVEVEGAAWTLDDRPIGAGLDTFVKAPAKGEHRLTVAVATKGKRTERTVSFVTIEVPKE